MQGLKLHSSDCRRLHWMALKEHRYSSHTPAARQTYRNYFKSFSGPATSNVPHPLHYCLLINMYSGITSTKSPSFCVTTFSASLTKLMALLPQSHDCSCYVSRRIMKHPPLWLPKRTDLRAHNLVHSPDVWRRPRLANFTWARSWRLCGITPAISLRLVLWRTCKLFGVKCIDYNGIKLWNIHKARKKHDDSDSCIKYWVGHLS
jgi:hypothetical protein